MSASGNGPSSCTTGAMATPGATMNVSMLKRPMNIAWAFPSSWVSMSHWYQAEGPLGYLDDEEVEFRVGRQPGHVHGHRLDRALRLDPDPRGCVREARGRGTRGHHVEADRLVLVFVGGRRRAPQPQLSVGHRHASKSQAAPRQ